MIDIVLGWLDKQDAKFYLLQVELVMNHHDELVQIMDFLSELWIFLVKRKKLWLAPIIIVMLALGGMLILVQGSVVAPFIYTMF